MKKKLLYILIFCFIPFFSNADWIRLFSINTGDLYINSSSIKRENNRIFYSQLVNYNNKQLDDVLSFITYSEVDCTNLKIRDIKYELFKKKMGIGQNFYKGTPSRKWKKYKQGTSAHLVNKLLCDRVHKK